MVMNALHSYTERSVCDSAALHGDDDDTVAILQGIRLLLMDSDKQGRVAIRSHGDRGGGDAKSTAVTLTEKDCTQSKAVPETATQPGNEVVPGPALMTPTGCLGTPQIVAEGSGGAGLEETRAPEGSVAALEQRMARMEGTLEAMAAMMKRHYGNTVLSGGQGNSAESEAQVADAVPPPSKGADDNTRASESLGRVSFKLSEPATDHDELARANWLPDMPEDERGRAVVDSTAQLERLLHGFRVARNVGVQSEGVVNAQPDVDVVLDSEHEKEEPQGASAGPVLASPCQRLRQELAEAMTLQEASLCPLNMPADDHASLAPRAMHLASESTSLAAQPHASRQQAPMEAEDTVAGRVLSRSATWEPDARE
eukprot:2278789-Rhodomonas_salina.2